MISLISTAPTILTPFDCLNGLKSPVSQYIRGLKDKYDLNPSSHSRNIVIGNEAADMDSISAAIIRSFELSLKFPDQTFYPVVNIFRKDFHLRRDIEFLLEELGISSDLILFLDDISPSEGDKLHLVDHNILAASQSNLSDNVITIVDHHHDEGTNYPSCIQKTIELSGSATTLIARSLVTESLNELDPSWAILILSPILLDTENFQSVHKTEPCDRAIYCKLEKFLPKQFVCADFFRKLNQKRYDVQGFSPDELFRKDVKKYQTQQDTFYTISSLPNGTGYLWKKDPKLIDAFHKYREENSLKITMILELSGQVNGQVNEILRLHVCAADEFFKPLVQYFMSDEELSSLMTLEEKDQKQKIAVWTLPNHLTRKTIQPRLLKNFKDVPNLVETTF